MVSEPSITNTRSTAPAQVVRGFFKVVLGTLVVVVVAGVLVVVNVVLGVVTGRVALTVVVIVTGEGVVDSES